MRTIFKSKLTCNFTTLPNKMLRDKRLSYKARGLLAMVLSNNDEWDVNRGWMSSQSEVDGRDAVDSALKELRELGYVVFYKRNASEGRFECVWEFHDTPNHKTPISQQEQLPTGFAVSGSAGTGFSGSGFAGTSEETATRTASKQKTKEVAIAPSRRFSDNWIAAFQLKFGEIYRYLTKDGVQAARLLKDVSPEEAIETAKKAWAQVDDRRFWNCVHRSRDVASFASCYTKIRLELKGATARPLNKVKIAP